MTDQCSPSVSNLWVADSYCACRVLELILQGIYKKVSRRPTETERAHLIKSGNVFVYEESENNLKRWTDGFNWSPSRISGNFLIYREVNAAWPSGQKKKALKRKQSDDDAEGGEAKTRGSSSDAPGRDADSPRITSLPRSSRPEASPQDKREAERQLHGSLIDSYNFKEDGLMKKTISVQYLGKSLHLVSYYRPSDIVSGLLRDCNNKAELKMLTIRQELLMQPSFRAPLAPPPTHWHQTPTPHAMSSSYPQPGVAFAPAISPVGHEGYRQYPGSAYGQRQADAQGSQGPYSWSPPVSSPVSSPGATMSSYMHASPFSPVGSTSYPTPSPLHGVPQPYQSQHYAQTARMTQAAPHTPQANITDPHLQRDQPFDQYPNPQTAWQTTPATQNMHLHHAQASPSVHGMMSVPYPQYTTSYDSTSSFAQYSDSELYNEEVEDASRQSERR